MPWDTLDAGPRDRPLAHFMALAYDDYKNGHRKPIPTGPPNQCAIRMSFALGRCGFSLDNFPDKSALFHFTEGDTNLPYVKGAEELSDYLRKCWGHAKAYTKRLGSVPDKLSGKQGVVYFEHCFKREGSHTKNGNHIDFWNGTNYYNDLIGVGAGTADPDPGGSLFKGSSSVYFYPLT